MPQTLFEKLKAAETINEDQRRILGKAKMRFDALETLGVPMPTLPDAITYDVATVQRGLFDAYRSNPLVRRALVGEESLEDAAKRLGAGRGRLLPKRRDDAHNARVAELSELVPHADNLLRRGVFRLDNALAVGLVIGGPMAALLYTFGVLEGNPREALVTSGLAGGGFGGLFFLGVDLDKAGYSRGILDNARYIDGKIQEFY